MRLRPAKNARRDRDAGRDPLRMSSECFGVRRVGAWSPVGPLPASILLSIAVDAALARRRGKLRAHGARPGELFPRAQTITGPTPSIPAARCAIRRRTRGRTEA
jgi:hypothetical protein